MTSGMGGRDASDRLTRLLQEIARLEAELKTANLLDSEAIANYTKRIRDLQRAAVTLKRSPNGSGT